MRVRALAVIAVLLSSRSFCQTATVPPSFEVASVKLADSSNGVPTAAIGGLRRSGGRLSWTETPIALLMYAYHLPEWRILGMARGQPFYSIDATMDPSTTEDQVRLMMQKVLVDRLKLVTHRESREFDGYALAVAKSRAKLGSAMGTWETHPMPEYMGGKASDALEGRVFVSSEGEFSALTGRGVSLARMAETLSGTLGTFVLDKTGMTGKYYFGFKFANDVGSSETEIPTLSVALQRELGLKLVKQRGPVEVLVVDHIEKVPTGN